MFNKSFWAMKQDLAHGHGVGFSLFGGQGVASGDKQAILDYNTALKNGVPPAKAWATTMSNASIAAQEQTRQCIKSKGSLTELANGLQQTTAKAKGAELGLKALSIAGNMLMMMGISLAISGIAKGFQALANAQENAIEKANEFISKFEEQRNTLKSNKEAIDSISADYEKLAKGVDSLGRNVSLNSDDYARYNEIVNQIADMFPQMVQGYTDEGNAIITHKGNVEELTKAYQEQKKAAQDAIIVGSADVFKGFKAKVDNVKDFFGEEYGLIQKKEQLELASEILNYDQYDNTDAEFNKLMSRFVNSGLSKTVLKEAGIDEWSSSFTGVFDILTENKIKILSYLESISRDIESEAAKIKPIMQAYLEQSFEFQGLDEKAQDIVKQIVGQFDSEFYAQFDNETEMASWVETNVLDKLRNNENLVNDFSVVFDLQTKYNNGEISYNEFNSKAMELLRLLKKETTFEVREKIMPLFGYEFILDDDGSGNGSWQFDGEKLENRFGKEIADKVKGLKKHEVDAALTIDPKTISSYEDLKIAIDSVLSETKKANKTPVSLKGVSDVKNELDKLLDAYEDDMELTTDEVADILEEHPEYIQYLTKVGDKYKVNQKALDDWNKATEEQQRLIDEQMGSNQYATEYNPLLDRVSQDTSKTTSDGDGNWKGGSEALDGIIAKNKELNESFAEGSISATDYFNSLSDSITDSGLEDALDDIGGKFDETTDKIEATVAVLAGELSDAMIQASKRYELGKTSVGDYIDELDAGLDAQMKLLKSTYDLEVGEDGLAKTIQGMDDATKQAAESFNEAFEIQDDIDVVNQFADAMESYNDRIMQYVADDNVTLTDAILGDTQLLNTHMDNVTDSLVAFAGTSAEHYETVVGQITSATGKTREEVQSLIGASYDAVVANGDALQTAVGEDMGAINGLSQGAMDNAQKTITNASQAVGGVLTALGNAISNFDYTLTLKPEGSIDLFNLGDIAKGQINPTGEVRLNITGHGGTSLEGLSTALADAGTYFSSQTNNDVGGYSGYTPTTKKTTPAAKRPETKDSGSKDDGAKKKADDAKKAEEERIKKENEAFKAGLETRKKVLERYKAALDLTDFGLDITEEGDFSTRADLLNNKMSQITSYGEAMRKEFDRVTKIIPKTGEQADALASHIQSLGGDIRENVKLLRETRVAMEKLKIDSVVSVGDYYLEDLTSVLDDIESRIDRLSNDNNDDYEYTNKILNMKALLPTRSGTKNVRNERRGADHDVIQAEQETQDAINDIIETQIRKNEKLREDERTAILNELQELRANTQIKLTEFQDDVSNSCDIVTARIDTTDVQFPEPSIDFSKAEKQFDDFGKVTDRLSNKAADLADSLAQIAIACGEPPPNPLPRYATGTPNGNAKTKNLGIAGENYKPEILVDKATGKTTYIDKPTVFDLSTTDVIGEKATNSIPKFAKGTINPNYDKRPFNKRLEEFEARVSDWLDAHSGVGYPFEQIYPISSPYGIRVHPVTGQIRMHTGVDFGAGLGTKILSTTFGTVETSSWYGGYGNCVIIRELNGNRWLYGHMVEPSHLRPGDRIRRGELVGYVGSTGVSTGPHLHLERMPANGGYTDPLPYLPYYEAGTPDGNAKARRFGIAGENFKPEILIDKATGKTTYIDKPTVFDLSTTDVIGEKATAGMSKFATGTPTTDETVRQIIKKVCDEYEVPYEIALAVLDRESGNTIKLTANPDSSSYSHTSWQLYDYGVWADVSKADKDFINKAAEQGESGENFYEAFAIATKYAISALAQHYKSTGSWQGAVGKYNGSGTYGSYAKEVIKASNSAPFKEAAKALGDNTDALETNTTAIETDNDKKLTPEEKAVQDIQSRVNEMMAEIDKEAAKVTAESIKIHSNESLSDDEKAIESFKVLYPAADTGRKVGTDAYRGLLSQFLAWWEAVQNDPETFSQETFDAYVKGLEELEDTVLNFEDTLANSKENVLNIMENSLSDIDDYISEHNDDGDWSLVGDSEADAIRRKMDIIQKYRDEDILSEEKYQKLIKELRDDEVDAEFEHSSNWIDERNQKGDWALYGDSEYEAWQRVAKWLREKYPDELDKIHEADQNAIDAKYQHSQNWIDERNAYNDWALFDDTEVDAWERVVKWLHEDYPNDINKLKEAEKNLFEARKKELNDATTFGNSYLESQKTLLQAHYGVENAIAEARHEINKELATSKTMYEYLDEDSRKLLFNQDDYNKLRKELNTIENKSLDLQSEYESKLKGATLETIESITSEYQMQYETLMKSYEIAKADLEIAKKKQKLNNVLAERNVRMFVNGSWQWVANTKDVADAQSELADAKYAKQVEEAGLTQKQSIDDLTRQQNELSLVVKEFEGGVISLDEAVKKAGKAINYIPQAMMDMLNNAKVDTKAYSQGSSSRSSNGVWYDSNYSLDSQQDNNSKSTRTAGGLTFMGEFDDELYISSHGRLIPITQPTIENIPSGGAVFNSEQMKNIRTLWDMSNLKLNGIDFMGGVQHQQTSQTYDNRIIINGMTVDNGSADGQTFISALQRYVGNH